MTKRNYFNSIWENKKGSNFKIIQESDGNSVVDGIHVLARVSGPSFFPDTTSRNNVHYPKNAWENAINNPEFQERLKNKLIFGTIGHDPEMTDNEVRDGIHSHIVSKIWIDENNIGMAEYLILNTEPGKVLNTLLRAGSKLSVSTRAYGGIKEDKSPSGAEVVDPEDFNLERIDFVIDPGYKEAKPILQENNKDNKKQEENTMADVNVNTGHLEKQVVYLTEQYDLSTKEIKELQKALMEAKVNSAKNQTELDSYRALGTLATLQESVKRLSKFEDLGTPEDLEKTLEEGTTTIQDLTAEIERLQALKAELEKQVTENDQADELKTSQDQLKEFEDLGTPEEIEDLIKNAEEMKNELDQYHVLGTPEEIKNAFSDMEKIVEDAEKEELQELIDEYDIEPKVVDLLKAKGLSVDEIKGVLDSTVVIKGDRDIDISEDDDDDKETPTDDDDDDDDDNTFGESLSSHALRKISQMKRIKESKGKTGNRKMAGKKSYKESYSANVGSNRLLNKLINA